MITITFDAAYSELVGFDSLSSQVKDRIQKNLSYIDSKIDYQNKMGNRYAAHKDPTVNLLEGNCFYTGLLPRVAWILDNCNVEYNLVKNTPNTEPSQLIELPDWLYTHQLEIIQKCLEFKRGIIESPTGSGKSISIAYLLTYFGREEIIVTVPQQNLLKQLSSTLEEILQEPIGRVSGHKKNFERVTVGVINTLSNMAKDGRNFSGVDVLICDEAHRVGANFYRDLCNACINTDYRLGFTATAERQSGDEKVMEGLLGPELANISETYLMKENILCGLKYLSVPFKSKPLTYSKYNKSTGGYYTKNNKPDRNEVYKKNITQNVDRNKFIGDIVVNYMNSDPEFALLVFIQFIEHGEILQDTIKSKGLDLPFVYGKKKKQSDALIEELRAGTVKAAIVSSIFNEGVDIKPLGVGIIAGGGGSKSRIKQQIGRMIRRTNGKKYVVVMDIADDEPYYLATNYYTRKERVNSVYPDCLMTVEQQQALSMASNGFKNI